MNRIKQAIETHQLNKTKNHITKFGLIAFLFLVFVTGAVFLKSPSQANASCTAPSTSYGTDTLSVTVPSTTTYNVWTQLNIPSSSSDSIMLQLEQTGTTNANCYTVGGNSSLSTNTWNWVDYASGATSTPIQLKLNAGSYMLTYTGTSPGVGVDDILLLSDLSCVPQAGTSGSNCTTTTPPSPPTNVTAVADSSTSVTVSWMTASDSGGPGIAGYYVFRGSTQLNTTPVTGTTYTDSTASPYTSYTYTVEAVDTAGNQSTAGSAPPVTTKPSPPPMPSGVTATAKSSTSINVSWASETESSGPGIAGYYVLRSTSSGGTYTNLTPSGVTTNSYTDNSVSAHTTYYYEVEAYDSASPPDVSNPTTSAPVTTPYNSPSAPTGLGVGTTTATSVNLSWTTDTSDSGGPGIAGYYVLRANSSSGTYTNLTPSGVTTNSYTDSTVSPSTTYYYEVEAYDSASPPNVSPASGSVKASTTSVPIPNAPTSVSGTANSDTSVSVSWTAATPSTGGLAIGGYYVLRSTSSTGAYSTIGSTPASTTSYTDSTVSPKTTYYYEVEAYDTASTPDISNPSTPSQPITTPSVPLPNAPTGVSGTANSDTSVSVSWKTATPGANGGLSISGYYVLRSTSSSGPFSNLTPSGVTSTSYTDTTVSPSTVYYYEVEAYDSASTPNVSNPSSVSSPVTTPAAPAAPIPAPTGLAASAVSSSQINLSWSTSDASGISGYYVYSAVGTATTFTKIATVTTTSYGYTGLSPSTSYSFYVVAYSGNASSPNSSTVSATDPPAAGGGTGTGTGTGTGSTTTVTVEGTVTNTSGAPIKGAFVYANNKGATASGSEYTFTNSSGQYVLANIIPNENINYVFAGRGYKFVSYTWSLPGGLNTKNVTLTGYGRHYGF